MLIIQPLQSRDTVAWHSLSLQPESGTAWHDSSTKLLYLSSSLLDDENYSVPLSSLYQALYWSRCIAGPVVWYILSLHHQRYVSSIIFTSIQKRSSKTTAVPSDYMTMSANTEFQNLDKALSRLHLTPERLRNSAQKESSEGREWKRGTLEQSRNQKYLLEDKKVIASGDIPLGNFPLSAYSPLTSSDEDHKLFNAWNFVNELYDELKQAGKNEVHKLKKLRRKIAGPLMLGLHLIMAIVAAQFRVMIKELSEQEFDNSLNNGEARDYAEAADRAWKRFDVVSKIPVPTMSREAG